jgi:hypothetical protein
MLKMEKILDTKTKGIEARWNMTWFMEKLSYASSYPRKKRK